MKLFTSIFSATITIASTTNVEEIAQQITVRIQGNSSLGTGVIVERRNKTYYILTSSHVVKKKGNYLLATPDKKCYGLEHSLIKPLTNLDLAILPLTSPHTYRVAQLGNSSQLSPGQTVYVAGWTYIGDVWRSLIFFTGAGKITEVNSKLGQGYSLTYTNLVRAGMSGGPLLDSQGKLIGINGLIRIAGDSEDIVASGIGINEFVKWRAQMKTALPVPRLNQINCPRDD